MRKALVGWMMVALLIPALAAAGQRPGGGGGTAKPGPGAGQRTPPRSSPAPRHPQVREGHQSAQQVESRARDLERHAARSPVATLTKDRDRIRDRVQDMDKAQQQWRDGLGDSDRLRLQDRLRDLDQQRDRLRTHLAALDTELARPQVDRARIQELAREVHRETELWRTTWRDAAQGMPAAPQR